MKMSSACPESFDEFYNQRRRWMPSTMLNILDLLQNWKLVTAQNEDISFLYIFYQVENNSSESDKEGQTYKWDVLNSAKA